MLTKSLDKLKPFLVEKYIAVVLFTFCSCDSSGIELILGTRVKSADVRRKTLLTVTGETISYKYLIVATGARVLKLFFFYFSGTLVLDRLYVPRGLGK